MEKEVGLGEDVEGRMEDEEVVKEAEMEEEEIETGVAKEVAMGGEGEAEKKIRIRKIRRQ